MTAPLGAPACREAMRAMVRKRRRHSGFGSIGGFCEGSCTMNIWLILRSIRQ